MKVSTTINEVLKNIGVPEIEIIVDKEIIE